MTREQRIAATECVQLMALLAEAKTPHAKELAIIVSVRLLLHADKPSGKVQVLTNHELGPWIEMARKLAL